MVQGLQISTAAEAIEAALGVIEAVSYDDSASASACSGPGLDAAIVARLELVRIVGTLHRALSEASACCA